MSQESSILKELHVDQEKIELFFQSKTLSQRVICALQLAISLACQLVELELNRRAALPTDWPLCPQCGNRIERKGFRPRSLLSLLGKIHWKRRVGRCSQGCHLSQVVPLDESLEVLPLQRTMNELKEMGCLLAVFMPYQTSAFIFEKLLSVAIGASSIWTWVQSYGKQAIKQLEEEIVKYESGESIDLANISPEFLLLKCLVGVDGVFAPFRPHGGNPQGKTVWKES
jgi:hypothetical protein